MKEVRQDSLTPLRLYCRGMQAGYVRAALQTHETLAAEARALVAMEHLGFTAEQRWAIMDTAHGQAELEYGSAAEVDPYTLRHAAALAVIAWLRLVLRRRIRESR